MTSRFGLVLLALALAIGSVFAPTASAHRQIPPEIIAKIPKRAGPLLRTPSQIELGRRLFEKELFGGNGRTCATCHAAKESFTLNPADVRRRPKSDPLFVFERVPALAGLENGPALRSRALILENLDGFDQPGTLRGSMTISALALTTNPQSGKGVGAAALGWSGDGSPGDGSIRNFAVGAIVQHFTRSLARIEGSDFRLPTAVELDALEAFQLSLGRRETPIVDPVEVGHLVFNNIDVTTGQTLFHGMSSRLGTRRCSGCHRGGGALDDPPDNANEQVKNGTELTPNAPACLFPTAPGDGGFGIAQILTRDRSTFCTNGTSGPVDFIGNQDFNVQSIVEAASTAPFFHDNSAVTLEQAIQFYASDTFNDFPKGAGNGFIIPPKNGAQIAAFLRALNVLDAITNTTRTLHSTSSVRLQDARNMVRSAINVLGQGEIKIHQDARAQLAQALRGLQTRRGVPFALAKLEAARKLVISTP